MPRETLSHSSLLGGISQQAPAQRFLSQGEVQVNCYSSVVDGLTRRLPTTHIAQLIAGDAGPATIHTINRDTSERYKVVIRNGSIKVFDLAGTERFVHTPDGTDYLNTLTPEESIRALSIADYTFIVNREVTTALLEETSPLRNPEAMVWVRQGAYSTYYAITGDYTDTFTTSASAGHADTGYIASNIGDGSPGAFTVTQVGSVLHFTRSTPFDLSVTDGLGGNGLVLAKDSVQVYTDLPAETVDGMTIKVEGAPDDPIDDYWLKFKAKDTISGFGSWVETIQPGIKYRFDPATMPHVLIRLPDGDFVFKQANGTEFGGHPKTDFRWADRKVGDDESNPLPSFTGLKIENICLTRGRLGIFAGENIILSEVAVWGNFWRTTVTQLLDSDPIDTPAPSSSISYLRAAAPVSEKLVCFADGAQFILDGSPNLTPRTASVAQATTYEYDKSAQPVAVANAIFFPFYSGGFSGIREYAPIQTDANLFEGTDRSEHVDRYIRGHILKMAVSTVDRVLAVQVEDSNRLYIYKWFNAPDGSRVQSSWSHYEFGEGTIVRGIEFIESVLYLIIQRMDGLYLESLHFESRKHDTFSDTGDPAQYITRIDRRVDETQCRFFYDADTDVTQITLPYAVPHGATIRVATRPHSDNSGGKVIKVLQVDYGQPDIVVQGNHVASKFYAGEEYESVYEFTQIIPRKTGVNGSPQPLLEGLTQVLTGLLGYANTAYFEVWVRHQHGDVDKYLWTGDVLGTGSTILGQNSLAEKGTFPFAVLDNSSHVTVEVRSRSHFPFHLTSAEWQCDYSPQGRAL